MGSSEDPVSSNEGGSASMLMLVEAPFWAPVQRHDPRVLATLGMFGYGFVRLCEGIGYGKFAFDDLRSPTLVLHLI